MTIAIAICVIFYFEDMQFYILNFYQTFLKILHTNLQGTS